MVISGGIMIFLMLVIGGWHYISLTMAQRENTAHKLRRSQTRLSRAQQIARLGGWQYNFRTEEFSATDETYRLFGLARRDADDALRASQDFIHPEDQETIRQARIDALKTSHDYEIDYRIIRPNGDLCHIREKGAFEFDAHGARFRLAGTVHDVTEQRRIEERLRQQALIFDQVHEAVVSTDIEGKILSWNKGAERQSGFSAEEMIGNSIDLCIAPQDKERFWRKRRHWPMNRAAPNSRFGYATATARSTGDIARWPCCAMGRAKQSARYRAIWTSPRNTAPNRI
jgi:PAS domain S-box-containing protein